MLRPKRAQSSTPEKEHLPCSASLPKASLQLSGEKQVNKQNPFSLYDFLGYFIPGGVSLFFFCILIDLFRMTQGAKLSPVDSFLKISTPEMVIGAVLVAYISGHILSWCSASTLERFSVLSVGYPSRHLLNFKPTHYFEKATQRRESLPFRIFIWLILLPISLLDHVAGRQLHLHGIYARPLDTTARKVIKRKLREFGKNELGIDRADLKKGDVFRFVYHYVVENAPNHLPKIQNYVALYGFLRTLSLISTLFFWITLFFFVRSLLVDRDHAIQDFWFLVTVSFGGLAYVLYLDFVKFSRRFSLETLMALCTVYPPIGLGATFGTSTEPEDEA